MILLLLLLLVEEVLLRLLLLLVLPMLVLLDRTGMGKEYSGKGEAVLEGAFAVAGPAGPFLCSSTWIGDWGGDNVRVNFC